MSATLPRTSHRLTPKPIHPFHYLTNQATNANQISLLTSPPLKKGVSWAQNSSNSANSAYIFLSNGRYAHSEKSSGLIGPQSSSSQPSRHFFDYRSPSLAENCYMGSNENPCSAKSQFTDDLYRRIEDFLDSEGLVLIDAGDYTRGDMKQIRRFKMPQLRTDKDNMGDCGQIEETKSACQSPMLISENLSSSNLFQRRASHSQKPFKSLAIGGEDTPVAKKKPARLDFRIRSPIMEKDTPQSYVVSSRGSMWNTPASVKDFRFFGHFQGGDAVSKECSPEIKGRASLKGAKSVHGRKSNAGFFKN